MQSLERFVANIVPPDFVAEVSTVPAHAQKQMRTLPTLSGTAGALQLLTNVDRFRACLLWLTLPAARRKGINVAGTLLDYQIWQLVAYVRSLGGLSPGDVAPGRSDHMSRTPPEQNREPEKPVAAPPSDVGNKPK